MKKSLLVFTLGFALAFSGVQAQNQTGKELIIKKTSAPVVLDGKADEPDWQQAAVAKDFFLNFPIDTALAEFQTEVRVMFDDRNLYVHYVCHDDGSPYIVQSLRRDFDFDNNDNMALVLGPYNDKINGFFFNITPYNVQMEGTVSSGGNDFDDTWDNKWYSKTVRYDDRWEAELMIPFKSFRHKEGEHEWQINFLRWDRKRNQASTWIATPIQFQAGSFAYSGTLKWSESVPKTGPNISVIPYVAGSASVDREPDPTEKDKDFQAGFDAKIGLGSSMNLDLTLNPDCSQVELDRQVINLTRFEFQFPELRQFFLENSDLFSNAGFPRTRPFFTRRIGLAKDSSGSLQKVPILYGARLSGSLSKKWRMSVLNMHTKKQEKLGLPAQNYTAASLQRNFWKQSNFTLLYVDKESLNLGIGDSLKYYNEDLWKTDRNGNTIANQYNRVLTADLDLRSADNKWYGSYYYSKSFDAYNTGAQNSFGHFTGYTKRGGSIRFGQTFAHKNYNAETGFVPGLNVYQGFMSTFFEGELSFFPKKTVAVMGPEFGLRFNHVPGGTMTDRNFELRYFVNFLNTSTIGMGYENTYQQLTDSFNPIDSDKYTSFEMDEVHTWNRLFVFFRSNQRKLFRFRSWVSYGGFYNGTRLGYGGNFNYRIQPYGSIGLQVNYNKIEFQGDYGQAELVILRPQFNFTFTDKLFLTTTVQYNTSADNVNLNARFQWRYKPASDFFIVYTENYLPGDFASKNRALVFKFTYWLNL